MGVEMIISCAVCDDVCEEAKITRDKIIKIYKNCDFTCEVSIYNKGHHLMSAIEDNRNIQLMVLDVEMPEISGIDIARAVKKLGKKCIVIFLTSHNDYAVDGYELGVFRFIPKDRIDELLEKALMDAAEKIKFEFRKTFLIQHQDSVEKIYYDDINYVTKDGKNSVIHLVNKQTLQVRKSLSDVLDELNSPEFLFIDRGCITNINNVWKVDKKDWICANGIRLPMSGATRAVIKQKLFAYWGTTI